MPGRPSPLSRSVFALTLALCAGATTVPATAAEEPEAPAAAPAAPAAPAAVLTELRTLYQGIGAASEAHRIAEEQLTGQRARVDRLQDWLADIRVELAERRRAAGQLATQRYRAGTPVLPPALQLLLGPGDDLASVLHRRSVLDRAADGQGTVVHALAQAEERAAELAAQARGALDTQQALTQQHRRRRAEAEQRVEEAERLLSSLPPDQLAELSGEGAEAGTGASGPSGSAPADGVGATAGAGAGAETADEAGAGAETADEAGAGAETADEAEPGAGTGTHDPAGAVTAAEPAPGPPAPADRPPSPDGTAAVDFALAQLGKPYSWSATGPDRYDAPGLTSRAWQEAGHHVPETSRRQWETLAHVPLEDLRPGDLVIYYPNAAHSALYAGDGEVIHTLPGSRVALTPLHAHPVLGAVRPDPHAPPAP